jgi:outer membrane lipoprotein SlyB
VIPTAPQNPSKEKTEMTMSRWIKSFAAIALGAIAGVASAQTSVTHGRITNVTLVTEQNRAAQTGGAVLGGALGAASASNRSSGTAALRAGAGVLGGQAIGRVATQRQAFEYTILIDGTSTITMVTDEAGLRVGDCVAVERGRFNNLRLVDDSRCAPRQTQAKAAAKPAPPPAVTPAAQREADACVQAKDLLLQAETDEAFDRAYRRVRLLCQDY